MRAAGPIGLLPETSRCCKGDSLCLTTTEHNHRDGSMRINYVVQPQAPDCFGQGKTPVPVCRARESIVRHQLQHRLKLRKLKSHVNNASRLAAAEAQAVEHKVS